MSDIEWHRFLEKTLCAAKHDGWRRLTRLFHPSGGDASKRLAADPLKQLLRDQSPQHKNSIRERGEDLPAICAWTWPL